MARTKEQRQEEHLDDASFERVIKALEDKKTKKEACTILNISYNVSRLDKLIDAYLARKEVDIRLRKEKRGKPAAQDEIEYIVKEYLKGGTLTDIGNTLHRGVAFVKSVLETYDVPTRGSSPDYFKPQIIPDGASADRFALNEVVYSVRYESLARIRNEIKHRDGFVYGIYLLDDKYQENAYQPAWELASLKRLREIGINI